MGCPTSRLVHNPMPILGSAPRAGTRAEQLRRSRKKWCSNLAERGDASSHIPRHFPGTCITSHFLVALFLVPKTDFTRAEGERPRSARLPAPLAPQDQAKKGNESWDGAPNHGSGLRPRGCRGPGEGYPSTPCCTHWPRERHC